jgi:RNA polymerase sigma factor (sigma-70 family)
MGLSTADSADVFQEVLLALLSGIHRLREPAALAGWLLRAASRIASRHRASLRREAVVADDGFWDQNPDPSPEASEIIAELESAFLVRAAIERMGSRCAQLLEALFLEEPRPSYEELSDRLGLPVGSLGPTRMRCLHKLLGELEKLGIKPARGRTSRSTAGSPTAGEPSTKRGLR